MKYKIDQVNFELSKSNLLEATWIEYKPTSIEPRPNWNQIQTDLNWIQIDFKWLDNRLESTCSNLKADIDRLK